MREMKRIAPARFFASPSAERPPRAARLDVVHGSPAALSDRIERAIGDSVKHPKKAGDDRSSEERGRPNEPPVGRFDLVRHERSLRTAEFDKRLLEEARF